MNDGDPGSNRTVGELAIRSAMSFEAFYDRYQDAWVRYAHAQTGSREVAEEIVDALTEHMAESWHYVQRHESAAQHAWKVLKATVARWLNERETESAFVETAVFDQVTRVLAEAKERFAKMEESLGLYSAISRLSERQYDAVVLCHVLNYPCSTAAFMLGVTESTVRSNLRHARRHLAKELGIQHPIETEA